MQMTNSAVICRLPSLAIQFTSLDCQYPVFSLCLWFLGQAVKMFEVFFVKSVGTTDHTAQHDHDLQH